MMQKPQLMIVLFLNYLLIIATSPVTISAFHHAHLSLCRIVDGTEDSEGTESSPAFSYSTSQGCPVNEPISASASATGPPIVHHTPVYI